jgi:hypothetical protein
LSEQVIVMNSAQFGKLAQADFFTTTHRISGQVYTGSKPLSDLLNDRNLSYLMAVNVYVSRLHEPGEIGAHTPMAYLPKENLSFVVVQLREVRPVDRNRFAAQEYEALVTLPGFEIKGKFMGPRRVDIQSFSPASLDLFMILTMATAQIVALPEVTFCGEVILVNRARLESLGLSEQKDAQGTGN